jgi:signal transduction histidine kinase
MAFREQQWLHPIRWLREHPRAADFILAAAVTALTLIGHFFAEVTPDDASIVDPAWWTVGLIVIGAMPIYWRRTHPVGVALVVVAVQVVALLLGVDGAAFVAASVAVYSLGAHSGGLRRTRTLVTIGAMVLLLFVAGWVDGHPLIGEFVSTNIVLVSALALGDNMRRRREHLDDLAERADRAEREQGLLAEQRVIAERTRIARELHDVVAHSVSVMVIQSAAARRSLHVSVDNAEAALEALESTGRQTMRELRGLLGVLRTDDASDQPLLDPSPTMLDIDALMTDDLPVTIVVDGPIGDLPSSVALTGYRIVQEALTNVRRHAGPVTEVVVTVDASVAALVIAVVDDGRGAAADVTSADGYGLIGMEERVAAVGGFSSAGPRPGGGWGVRAVIPLDGADIDGDDADRVDVELLT